MRPHRELLGALGCEVVVVAETTRCIHGDRRTRLSQRPVLAPAEAGRDLPSGSTSWKPAPPGLGAHAAYHHHMGTIVQTEDEVDRLMDSCDDAVALLLDTGHLTFAGGDPVRVGGAPCVAHRARALQGCAAGRARSQPQSRLQLPRRRARRRLHRARRWLRRLPGGTCPDCTREVSRLAVVEAEQDPSVAPSAQYANLGYRNLRSFADAQAWQ